MQSLTGYGKSTIEYENRKLTIEIKSVNHRFLDLTFKMPKLFNFAEDMLRREISASCSRGHLDIYLNYEDNRDTKQSMLVNEGIASMYLNTAKELCEKYNLINDVTITSLMKVPDLVSIKYNDDSEEVIFNMLNQGIKKTLEMLVKMRSEEGKALFNDVSDRVNNIESMLSEVKALAPNTVNEYKNKLKARIEDALKDISIDESKLLNEVAFFTDKCNTDEEITRLSQHILSFRKIAGQNDAIGRKLDFLVQEMNREINTIGSKAQDIIIAKCVINMKNELEKVREQVQNIE